MISIGFIESILNREARFHHPSTCFRPGQIFNGRVVKLFPNQTAEVMIGSEKVIAKLEVPLTVGDRYWFQVQPGEGKIHLKVLMKNDGMAGKEMNASLSGLLKQLNLTPNQTNMETLRFLIKEHLPVSKEEIISISSILKGSQEIKDDQSILKEMVLRDIPVTKELFLKIKTAVGKDTIGNLIESLNNLLNEQELSTTGKQMQLLWKEFLSTGEKTDWGNGKEVLNYMKNVIPKLGFDYEFRQVESLGKPHVSEVKKLLTFKSMLIQLIDENIPEPIKQTSELLLDKLTGIQLLNQTYGPIEQYVLQLPVLFSKKQIDLTIQWNGRKKENGQIDPDYCRILCYLDLEYLNEVIVDIQIQNRVLNITIMNDTENIKDVALMFIPVLKDNLAELNYHLSSVQFEMMKREKCKQTKPFLDYSSHFHGVDIRI